MRAGPDQVVWNLVPGRPLELVYFCAYRAKAARPDMVADIGGVCDMTIGVVDARWEGDSFMAAQQGDAAVDWLTIRGGIASPDVRMTLHTDDGAYIYVAYQGRADWRNGFATRPSFTTFIFETGDARYRWMNHRLFAGRGETNGVDVAYDVYEVR